MSSFFSSGIFGTVENLLGISTPSSRLSQDEANDAKAALAASQGQAQALGESELAAATPLFAESQSATMTPGQQAQVSQFTAEETANANNFMAQLGLSNSTMAKSMQSQVAQNAAIMGQNFISANQTQFFNEAESHFQNAINALGMSNADIANMYSIADQDQQRATQATTSLLTTIGTMVAAYFTGGAAAAVGAGALSAASSTAQPTTTSGGIDVTGGQFNETLPIVSNVSY